MFYLTFNLHNFTKGWNFVRFSAKWFSLTALSVCNNSIETIKLCHLIFKTTKTPNRYQIRRLLRNVPVCIKVAFLRTPPGQSMTFITLLAILVDDKSMIFSYFSQKTEFDISWKLSAWNIKTVFWERWKYFNMSSTEICILSVSRRVVYLKACSQRARGWPHIFWEFIYVDLYITASTWVSNSTVQYNNWL